MTGARQASFLTFWHFTMPRPVMCVRWVAYVAEQKVKNVTMKKTLLTKQEEKAVSIVNKDILVTAGMALLLPLCLAGALWTAYWSLRFGLTPRPPLSAFQTLVRFLVVMLALLLWRRPGDLMERSALAGSSGLYGLGLNSIALQVVRLLFHFLAYSLGVVAIIRWFRAKRAHRHTSVKAVAL